MASLSLSLSLSLPREITPLSLTLAQRRAAHSETVAEGGSSRARVN